MPTITISKKVLEERIGKKLAIDELKDRISLLGTDLEGIDGDEITVEIFPSRPDLLSEQGFARALASFIGAKTGLQKFTVNSADSKSKVIVEESVGGIRPFTACAIVRNLKLDDEKIKEIVNIQEKLHITYGRHRKKAAIGIYPLEHITLPIYYKALAPDEIKFRPLEGRGEMTGSQILEFHPTGKEYAKLLEGKDRYPIFVDSANEILSMPPIINSESTGRITESTTDVFIECSGFDYATLSLCLNMIVTTLSDMGGVIEEMTLKYPDKELKSPDLTPTIVELETEYANTKIGLDLTSEKIKFYLERMGYGVELGKDGKLNVHIPAYRADILHPIDLVEDLAVGYGYDKLEEEIPKIATIASENPHYELEAKTAGVLTGLGFQEAMTYHLSNDEDQIDRMNNDENSKVSTVKLKSAVNSDYNVLRRSIIPGLLRVFASNKHHEYPQKVFEIGTVFLLGGNTETQVTENQYLGVCNAHQTADFTEIKQQLDALMRGMDVKYTIIKSDNPSFITGRCGKIIVNEKEIGFVGELHPQVLTNFEIEHPVSGFEINLELLFQQVLS